MMRRGVQTIGFSVGHQVIVLGNEMNVKARQNRLGRGVRRGHDRAGSRPLSRQHIQSFIFNGVRYAEQSSAELND